MKEAIGRDGTGREEKAERQVVGTSKAAFTMPCQLLLTLLATLPSLMTAHETDDS